MPYYIYILECSNGAYYTGYTTDMVRRYQEHTSGSPKCKYTRSFPPLRLAVCWEVAADVSQALKIEKEIKKLSNIAKGHLIAQPGQLREMLPAKTHDAIESTLITPIETLALGTYPAKW